MSSRKTYTIYAMEPVFWYAKRKFENVPKAYELTAMEAKELRACPVTTGAGAPMLQIVEGVVPALTDAEKADMRAALAEARETIAGLEVTAAKAQEQLTAREATIEGQRDELRAARADIAEAKATIKKLRAEIKKLKS